MKSSVPVAAVRSVIQKWSEVAANNMALTRNPRITADNKAYFEGRANLIGYMVEELRALLPGNKKNQT